MESEIKAIITHYYKSEAKANDWYDTDNRLLDSDKLMTPRKMVDAGRGEEVLTWLKTILR